MTSLKVSLGERSYPVKIGAGAFECALKELAKLSALKRKIVCVADKKVLELHKAKARALAKYADIIPVEGGEKSKCFSKLGELCSLFAQKKIDRKSCVIALGGGVVGDLAGFAAAVYMRGVDFYQIPTTLLAMVDSSVGGKTGINIAEGKNLVGAFHQPRGVFADTDFLKTLPKREFAAGMAEVVKCAVLGDEKLFDKLEKLERPLSHKDALLAEAIKRSCALKAKVVAADERETSAEGGRALLNLGHTFGHAIENCAGYGKFLHGEAVSIGMVMAALLSHKLGVLDAEDCLRIERVLRVCGLPVCVCGIPVDSQIEAMGRDKKAFSGNLRFVIINKIGEARTAAVEKSLAEETLKEFCR